SGGGVGSLEFGEREGPNPVCPPGQPRVIARCLVAARRSWLVEQMVSWCRRVQRLGNAGKEVPFGPSCLVHGKHPACTLGSKGLAPRTGLHMPNEIVDLDNI